MIDHRTKRLKRHRYFLIAVAAAIALPVLAVPAVDVARAQATEQTAPTSPRDVHQAFAAAFNARDLEGMLALYESGAAVVPEPGEVVTGSDNLRAAMKGYLELQGELRIRTVSVIEAGGIALTRSLWEVREGGEVTASSSGAEVMRLGADGTWRMVVDNPFGAASL